MRARRTSLAAGLVAVLMPAVSLADTSDTAEAQRAQLDALRAQVASQIQLKSFDLLDELVFAWTQNPIFPNPTAVVLADVGVPLGLGTGLKALLENHLAALLIANPKTNLTLVHCPMCTAVVVHSGAKGTVVSHGADDPEALAAAGGASGGRHALYLDFEAEGAALVLRARITAIEPARPIIYARTLSSSTSSPAMLRAGDHLKSASEARQEYLEALAGRGTFTIPLRLAVRSYAMAEDAAISTAPFVWVQGGVEVALTQAAAWTASFSAGYTWAPEAYSGWLVQARLARLVSGTARSLTQPDLYVFLGPSLITISGPTAALFKSATPDLATIIASAVSDVDIRSSFMAWQLGLELRIKNRIGASVFAESLPGLGDVPNLGSFLDLGIVTFRTLGAEVSFCF